MALHDALRSASAALLDETPRGVSDPGWLPPARGLYALYASADGRAMLGVPGPALDRPLYVGRAVTSLRQELSDGLLAEDGTSRSGVRRSLAALLRERLELAVRPPVTRGGAVGLMPESDARLQRWLGEHGRLTCWVARTAALEMLEQTLVQTCGPPLNLNDVRRPWPHLREARARMVVDAARR